MRDHGSGLPTTVRLLASSAITHLQAATNDADSCGNLQKYLSPSPRRVNFTIDCCPVYQQGREGEQERTWASLLPLRKTVKPLHLSSWANRNASATSDSVAVEGRLIVFETPLSLER